MEGKVTEGEEVEELTGREVQGSSTGTLIFHQIMSRVR